MIAETQTEHQSDAGSTKDTPYLALTGELFSEYFWENWPRYNGTALYCVPRRLHNLVTSRQQDKANLALMERKLQEERKSRAVTEQQLASERKCKRAEEAAAARAVAMATQRYSGSLLYYLFFIGYA